MSNLTSIDLNLLVAFDALIAERSVTRAADRVSLTQSGMSRALSRLREAFDDPLFVRTRREMVPTPRAEDLAGPIRETLQAFEALLNSTKGFDPATSDRSFKLASDDYASSLMVPRFAERIFGASSSLSFEVVSLFPAMFDQLDDGALDLVLLPEPPAHRPSLRVQRLLQESFTAVVRAGHPGLRDGAMSLAAYANHPHVLISPGGKLDAPVDATLKDHGFTRRVALRMSNFQAAAQVVEHSDMIMTLPSRLVDLVEDRSDVVRVDVPLEIEGFGLYQVWHSRLDRDPGHRWLRAKVKALSEGV